MAFLAAFALYAFTLCPGIWVGDSGELIAAGWSLGIPHPTGYPLWLLLAKGFAAIVPFGSVAWRMNLFSALCAALAAQLLAGALRRLGCGRTAAFAAALGFACLGPVWGEATVARTYPLAAACSAGLLWCVARWLESGVARWLLLHQLLLGVALANHTMVVAHLPALLVLLAARGRALLARPRAWAAGLLALLPGLALYGWLPLRAAADPALEWRVAVADGTGAVRIGELEEPRALLAYLRRDAHHERSWAASFDDHLTIVRHHAGEVLREWGFVGVPLVVLGAVALWRARRKALLAAAVALWAANLAPLALHGAWWDLFLYSRYMTCGWLALALLAGCGLELVSAAIRGAGAPARAARLALALALPVSLLVRNWTLCDRREAWLAEDYGRALLAELPADAQYLGAGDVALYPLLALRFAEGERPDLSIVSRAQLAGEADLVQARAAQRDGAPPPARVRPLFTADLETAVRERLDAHRMGLLSRLVLPGSPPPPREPFAPPAIRGLERDERDPFARSVIGAIEADLADAAAVRGDRAQARARLERVAALRCARPWGAARGIETLLALARAAQAAARTAGPSGEPPAVHYARAREDVLLAQRLAAVALECGDRRDLLIRLHARQLPGWLGLIDAQEFQASDPLRGLEGLRVAAERLDRVDLCVAHVRGLARMGRQADAEAACERYRERFPAAAELAQLARELAPGAQGAGD